MSERQFAILGYKDGRGLETRFSRTFGCTSYGNNIAIADSGNQAIRYFVLNSSDVGTIDKFDSDVKYDNPIFIESLDGTHLLVVHIIGTVRLIDTTSGSITTLITSVHSNTYVSTY